MPFNDNQKPVMYQTAPLAGGNPVHALLGAAGQVALRYNITAWQYNLWDGVGWRNCPDQAYWEPPIPVRAFTMLRTNETDATIEFNLAGYGPGWGENETLYQIHVVNTLPTRMQWTKRITRVYLAGSNSNFTELYMDA